MEEGIHPFISSGTWSLLGVKTPKPITGTASEQANYSNEGGVGYNRYQKNIRSQDHVNSIMRHFFCQLAAAFLNHFRVPGRA